jgi:hypothetical protein
MSTKLKAVETALIDFFEEELGHLEKSAKTPKMKEKIKELRKEFKENLFPKQMEELKVGMILIGHVFAGLNEVEEELNKEVWYYFQKAGYPTAEPFWDTYLYEGYTLIEKSKIKPKALR